MNPKTGQAAETRLLLVTVTKVETLAVLEAFRQHTGQEARIETRGDKAYHDLGTANGVRVWLGRSEMGATGLGAALQTMTKAIEAIQPAAVIMVGIAFGVNPTKQAIGDVLVSQRLAPYELQWIGTVDQQPKMVPFGSRPDASPWLLDAFRTAELSWRPATEKTPAVHFGLVLTGEKLVDNLAFRRQLCALESDAIGGEMEGAGLYAACQDKKVDWILVKAICDWADGDKETDRQLRQQLAARNAATLVLHVLQRVSLKRAPAAHVPSGPDDGTTGIAQTGSGTVVVGSHNAAAGQRGVAVNGDHHGDIHIH